jgi:methylated-DNA-[protein]-cysteine S-methyltransferase
LKLGVQKMPASTIYTRVDSPLGRIVVRGDGEFLTGLFMPNHKHWNGPDAAWQLADEPFVNIREQLAEYFAGQRRLFTLPLKLAGTPFQQRVWQELLRIPFGTTVTYAELARRIGRPKASRAVGHANGRNPISILVPCHRVIGANGTLTGYGGGLDRKRWLLDWERRVGPPAGNHTTAKVEPYSTSRRNLEHMERAAEPDEQDATNSRLAPGFNYS